MLFFGLLILGFSLPFRRIQDWQSNSSCKEVLCEMLPILAGKNKVVPRSGDVLSAPENGLRPWICTLELTLVHGSIAGFML